MVLGGCAFGPLRVWRGAWSRTQEVEGVYRLDEGAGLDEFFQFLRAVGVMTLLEEVHGAAIQREMLALRCATYHGTFAWVFTRYQQRSRSHSGSTAPRKQGRLPFA